MIRGSWYAKDSGASQEATLTFIDKTHYLLETVDSQSEGLIEALVISNRLGNIARQITLEDGSVFSSKENDTIDRLLKNKIKTNHFIHTLETSYQWIAIALVSTVLFSFVFFKWGIPWTSVQIAEALPEKTNQIIASHSMEFLDKLLFEKSTISEQKMAKIRQHFETKIRPLDSDYQNKSYSLHFREWKMNDVSVPNALALPSGDIILTDQFVKLCKTEDEMDSVLLHEMGHVVHRHGLKTLIETTFLSVAMMLMVGDGSGMGDMGIGLGSMLVTASYSRGHEAEADKYAFIQMLKSRIDPKAFADIMKRMMQYMEGKTSSIKKGEKDKSIIDYLSSHPNTQERMEIAKQFSLCYKVGLTECKIEIPKAK